MIVTIPSAGQYGVIADAAPQELPINAWSAADNIRFKDGYAIRFKGTEQVFDAPIVAPYWLHQYNTSAARFMVHAGLAAVYVDDGTTRTDITGTAPTGAVDDRWTGGVLNGVLVMNNGKDVPTYWGGNVANNLAALTGWDTNWRAKSLRPFKNYLVACHVTKTSTVYPHMVKWSEAADPGTIPASWNEADATIDAGEVDLAETGDLIIDQLPMGDVNVIYKQRSMYAMRYIGGQQIFSFQRMPGEVGALARGCIADTPKGHVVLTAGDVVIHSGQGPQSILTGRMRTWLFQNMDETYYQRSFVVANGQTNEAWVCFPEVGQTTCTKALVWNWEDNVLSIRDLASVTYGAAGLLPEGIGNTWSSDTETWSVDYTLWNESPFTPAATRLLFCNASRISVTDAGNSEAGTEYAASLERTMIALDDPYSVKTIRAVYPRVDGPTGSTLTIEVGGTMDAEVPITWGDPVTYTIGTTRKADAFATGRFLALRISSTASSPWRVKSIDLDVIQRGAY